MKHHHIITITATALLLGGCSTLPVQGTFKGRDNFLGQATGYLDGSGDLSVTTESGITCQGKFQYATSMVSGTGTMTCDDGRTGTFRFTSNGDSGMGFGKTNKGEPFKFVFGHNNIISGW